MRGCDVFRFGVDDENFGVRITPAAGAVKGDRMREVPLHPHLIEIGFIKYVEKRGKGPLFYDPSRKRRGEPKRDKRENPQYARSATARRMGARHRRRRRDGAAEPRLAPHLQPAGPMVRMDPEVRDAIEGHTPRTEGEQYGGDVPLDVKWAELQRLPRFVVKPPTGRRQSVEPCQEGSRRGRRQGSRGSSAPAAACACVGELTGCGGGVSAGRRCENARNKPGLAERLAPTRGELVIVARVR